MAVNINEDTEFNDALRKHGIIPPRPATPPTPPPPPSPTLSDLLSDFSSTSLSELADDAPDDEAEKLIRAYKEKKEGEMRREEKRGRFGRVYPIGREDYTREVTDASRVDEPVVQGEEREGDGGGDGERSDEDEDEGREGKGKRRERGTAVVCFLYKDGLPRSDRAFAHLHTLAQRYPRTKFVSIVGDKCIADLPDSRVPMIIIYKAGEILNQVVAWGADRERRIEELEALLLIAGAVHIPKHRYETHRRPSSPDSDNSWDDDDDDGARHAGSTNGRTKKNVRTGELGRGITGGASAGVGAGGRGRSRQDEDEGSDFEFDL